jgi:tryptophan-rich sensory protein
MKKYILAYIIYTLIGVGTVITLFIVYKEIDNSFSYKFVIGYLILLLLTFLYSIIVTVINVRKLSWSEIRKRLIRLIIIYLISSGLNLITKYFFKPDWDYVKVFTLSIGYSLGWAFFDLVFIKKK